MRGCPWGAEAAPMPGPRRSQRLLRPATGGRAACGRRAGRAAALASGLLALLPLSVQAQEPTTLAPQLFGPKNVLMKFSDRNCTDRLTGQGSTQSWTRVVGAEKCYEITTGYLCVYRCIFKLKCGYDSGSGVVYQNQDDLTCGDTSAPVQNFAGDWYWSQAADLFQGGCQPDGAGNYMKFAEPLEEQHWPNCSSFGETAPGEEGGPKTYIASYVLQFYEDLNCEEQYNVTTYGARPTSRFEFKLYRGAQWCYDMMDISPRDGVESRAVGFDMLNFRFMCGNVDSFGNGIMVQTYEGPKCTGTPNPPQTWQEVFYPMNFPDTTGLLFSEKCTRWGQFRVKMVNSFAPEHLPDCEDFACEKGPCSGGRIKDPTDTTGLAYTAEIRSSGGDPADARSVANSGAPERGGLACSLSLLAAIFAFRLMN